MFCPNCGTQNPPNAYRCVRCGVNLGARPQYVQQPIYGQYGGYPVRVPGKGFAIASMVCGICALALFWNIIISIACGIVAVVLGAVARNKGNMSNMATAGIVLGCVGLGLSVLIYVTCAASFLSCASMPHYYYY